MKDLTFLIVGLIIVLLVNYVGSFAFERFDLTSEKRYTLSNTSKELANSIDDIIYVKVYLEGDFPASYKRLRDETKEMLEQNFIRVSTNAWGKKDEWFECNNRNLVHIQNDEKYLLKPNGNNFIGYNLGTGGKVICYRMGMVVTNINEQVHEYSNIKFDWYNILFYLLRDKTQTQQKKVLKNLIKLEDVDINFLKLAKQLKKEISQ